ncbi:MAG: AAA family ATPase [Chloroflexi bacterium]|nr:AAA family ATPase [Chloroflexota bacterium]
MSDTRLPAWVRDLCDPRAYAHRPDSVELVQTHISYVFLAGELVYKAKKPVDFGFIEQLSLRRREHFCREEVRINERLAPGVYRGVVPIVRIPGGRHVVDPPAHGLSARTGTVVEWAVEMERLPDERTLARLLEAGSADPATPELLARTLLGFHRAAAQAPGGADFAGARAERSWWERERDEALPNIGGTWDPDDASETMGFIDEALRREAVLFDERAVSGRVVEGHGDLQARHIYLLPDASGGAPRVLAVDGIEFNEGYRFRYVDVGYDIAFTAMDLESLGHGALGDELVGRYIAGSADEALGVLQPLHRCQRAFIRGKVESLGARAEEIPPADRERLRASAARYFALSAACARRRAPKALILVCGLPGTGKSVLAGTVAGRLGCAYLSSDAIRRGLASLDASPSGRAGTALYGREMTERTYGELRRRAAAHLRAGRAVVVDATHASSAHRAEARRAAAAASAPALTVELRLSERAALDRIASGRADPLRLSDADEAVYRLQRDRFEPLGADEGPLLGLDAGGAPGALASRVAEAIAAARL